MSHSSTSTPSPPPGVNQKSIYGQNVLKSKTHDSSSKRRSHSEHAKTSSIISSCDSTITITMSRTKLSKQEKNFCWYELIILTAALPLMLTASCTGPVATESGTYVIIHVMHFLSRNKASQYGPVVYHYLGHITINGSTKVIPATSKGFQSPTWAGNNH